MKKNKNNKGYSLVEMLVVLVLFSVLAVIATQTLFLSFRGSRKSGNVVLVRNNIDHAVGVMERHLRNARSWDSCSANEIEYTDAEGDDLKTFTCNNTDNNIASGSAIITSEEVDITCTIDCTEYNLEYFRPPSIKIFVSGTDATSLGIEGSTTEIQTQIYLRNYD